KIFHNNSNSELPRQSTNKSLNMPQISSAAEFLSFCSQPSRFRSLTQSMHAKTTHCNIADAKMVILKDADPQRFLPSHYHDFLDDFDRKQANELPPHRLWDHLIDLQPGKQPPVARPYSMNHHELNALRDYLDKELAKGFIRVSRSLAAAPVLFMKNSNGDLRFCIDYRGLNSISVKNHYSLPLITKTLSQLSSAKFDTKLDIISAFNKLRIKEDDEWKAAFTCRYGIFELLALPFAEYNYEIFDKELLAIVNVFETWTAELGSVEASTLVISDHKNLGYFTTSKKLNRRQVRWNDLLSNYDFKIVFRQGKKNGKPDALTRISEDKPHSENDQRSQYQHQILLKPQQTLRLDIEPEMEL
ncbi:unnamed protein product, partial [Trifolium pratense]